MITRQMRREVVQLETLKQVLEQTAPGKYLGGVPPDLDAHRPLAGRLAGAAALALAVATIWLPWLAPGLHAAPQMMMN
jgi:hypothetical protein